MVDAPVTDSWFQYVSLLHIFHPHITVFFTVTRISVMISGG